MIPSTKSAPHGLTHTHTPLHTRAVHGVHSPIYITVMQIAQMVVGVVVSLAGYFYYQKDPTGCAIHPYVIKVSAVIYASYLYLVRL